MTNPVSAPVPRAMSNEGMSIRIAGQLGSCSTMNPGIESRTARTAAVATAAPAAPLTIVNSTVSASS